VPILLVSHETGLIRELCGEALWLRAGTRVLHRDSDAVLDQYMAETCAPSQKLARTLSRVTLLAPRVFSYKERFDVV